MAREVQGRCLRFSVSTNYCLGGGNDLLLGASLLVQFESRIRLQRNAGDPSSIPRPGRIAAEGIGHPLQYSCLENPMDGGAWWAAVHGVPTESDTTETT